MEPYRVNGGWELVVFNKTFTGRTRTEVLQKAITHGDELIRSMQKVIHDIGESYATNNSNG